MDKLIFHKQLSKNDCAIACMKMIFSHYGKNYNNASIRERVVMSSSGLSIKQLANALEKFQCRTLVVDLPFKKFDVSPLPCILPWENNHFVVLLGYNKRNGTFKIADPAAKILTVNEDQFSKKWASNTDTGTAIFVEPTPMFYNIGETKKYSLKDFLKYLYPHKKFFLQLFIGLVINFFIAIAIPFFSQSIIDTGIKNKDILFINILLIAQLILFFSRTAIDFLRSWIVLHLSYRINISSISDFIKKTLDLPLSYYSSYSVGEISQRMNDYSKIESFVSQIALGTVFTIFNGIVFSFILFSFSPTLFYVSIFFNILSFLWVVVFLNKRNKLNQTSFTYNATNQTKTIEIITNAIDIKVLNIQTLARYKWQGIQFDLFNISKLQLNLSQIQTIGGQLINESKNLIITYVCAMLVISGKISLGMMFSVQYILGQVQQPISQIIGMILGYQDAKISLERISEIVDAKSENEEINNNGSIITNFELGHHAIIVKNLYFKYDTSSEAWTLENLNFEIPPNSFLGIVGLSGCGKSTLLKILMKLYRPTQGVILLNDKNFYSVSNENWRDCCSSVLQESNIFSASIYENVSIKNDFYDEEKVIEVCKIVNLHEFILGLPHGYDTMIGGENYRLSQGQKQRLLIARALFVEPHYLFLDEATNALDSFNEKQILTNIKQFRKNMTIVAVAHRLSTIMDADNIIVIENGKIIENGSHSNLMKKENRYFQLYQIQNNINGEP